MVRDRVCWFMQLGIEASVLANLLQYEYISCFVLFVFKFKKYNLFVNFIILLRGCVCVGE